MAELTNFPITKILAKEIKDTFVWEWFSSNTKTFKATKNKNDERLEKKKQELEEMMEKLRQINADELSPRQALDLIYTLKKEQKKNG